MKQIILSRILRSKIFVSLLKDKAKDFIIKKTLSSLLKRIFSRRVMNFAFFAGSRLSHRAILMRNTFVVQLVFILVEFIKVVYLLIKKEITLREGTDIMGKVIFTALVSYFTVLGAIHLVEEYLPKEQLYFIGVGIISGLIGAKLADIFYTKFLSFSKKEE